MIPMGILSITELKKRILVGEKLIYNKIRERHQEKKKTLDEETVERLEIALGRILPKLEDKDLWQSYLKEVSSKQEILSERRVAIEDCIKELFLKKDSVVVEKGIEKKLVGDKNLKDLKADGERLPLPIFVDDIDYVCFRQADYDLRLGEEIYVTSEETPRKLSTMGKDGVLAIKPGEFGILMAHEYLFIPPDLMGFISIRLTYKQKGLVNISGFHADPGFYGRLLFAVFNAGPNDVPLRYKEPAFMIMFNELKGFSMVDETKWQGMMKIPIETIFGLKGTSVSARSLDERIKRLEMMFPVLVTGVIGVVVAVIAWLFTHR
jgi:dCTP deaminase